MARHYAMGNSLWLVTPQNTIIVVDSPESTEAATVIRNDMRQIPAIGNKPITFIIYTIFHGDHTFGARVCGNFHWQRSDTFHISRLAILAFVRTFNIQ
jgi:glyoxylase-like metal-dependent hydrolase (beta-lactamase superfamily II)